MDEVEALTRKQEERELELSSSLKQCSIAKDFHDANDINQRVLKENFDGRFYDAEIMGALFCIFDMILLAPEDEAGIEGEASDSIFSSIRDLRKIGTESADGNALLAKFGELKDSIIIKVPKNPRAVGMFHEYFVGISCTNKLRREVPNYAYILGSFKCNPPTINPDKSVTQWCSKAGQGFVNYVVYEKIDGKDLRTCIKDCNPVDYHSWIIQIALAIHIGAETYGFTHYDLHDENALMRRWVKNGKEVKMFYIPYQFGEETWYIRASKIATMIDFGRSRVEVGGESFGVYGFEEYGINPSRANPCYDIFKILGFSLFNMHESGNRSCFSKCYEMMNIFLDTDLDEGEMVRFLNKAYDTYFELPQDNVFNEKSIVDFLEAYEVKYPEMWNVLVHFEPKGEVLRCEDMCPKTENQAAKMMAVKFKNSVSRAKKGNDVEFDDESVAQYEGYLKSKRDTINMRLEQLSDSSMFGIPKTLNSRELDGFVANYMDPHTKLYSEIKSYKLDLEALVEYHELVGVDDALVDFQLSDNYGKWRRTYDSAVNRLAKTYVPSSNLSAKESYLALL